MRQQKRQDHGEATVFLNAKQTHKYGYRNEAKEAGNNLAHQVAERISDQRPMKTEFTRVTRRSGGQRANIRFSFGLINHTKRVRFSRGGSNSLVVIQPRFMALQSCTEGRHPFRQTQTQHSFSFGKTTVGGEPLGHQTYDSVAQLIRENCKLRAENDALPYGLGYVAHPELEL